MPGTVVTCRASKAAVRPLAYAAMQHALLTRRTVRTQTGQARGLLERKRTRRKRVETRERREQGREEEREEGMPAVILGIEGEDEGGEDGEGERGVCVRSEPRRRRK
eukprot:3904639-Rhodomonas_salina.1